MQALRRLRTHRGGRPQRVPRIAVDERRIGSALRIVVELQFGLAGWLERQPDSVPFCRALFVLRRPNLVEEKVSLVKKVNPWRHVLTRSIQKRSDGPVRQD